MGLWDALSGVGDAIKDAFTGPAQVADDTNANRGYPQTVWERNAHLQAQNAKPSPEQEGADRVAAAQKEAHDKAGAAAGAAAKPEEKTAEDGLLDTVAGIARERWDQWKKYVTPALDQWQADVDPANQAARVSTAQGLATTDVNQRYDMAESDLRRAMGRYGVNPGSGRFASALSSLARGRAADTAGAGTTARIGVLDRMRQGRMALAGLTAPLEQQSKMALADIAFRREQGELERANRIEVAKISGSAQSKAADKSGMWGLAGLGAAAFLFSDRRIKTDISKIAELENGLGVYEFKWLGEDDSPVFTGLMADEVLKVMPQHVRNIRGILAINYNGVFHDLAEAA